MAAERVTSSQDPCPAPNGGLDRRDALRAGPPHKGFPLLFRFQSALPELALFVPMRSAQAVPSYRPFCTHGRLQHPSTAHLVYRDVLG